MARRMTLADEDEILRFAQDDTGRELRLMPGGRLRRVPIIEHVVAPTFQPFTSRVTNQ